MPYKILFITPFLPHKKVTHAGGKRLFGTLSYLSKYFTIDLLALSLPEDINYVGTLNFLNSVKTFKVHTKPLFKRTIAYLSLKYPGRLKNLFNFELFNYLKNLIKNEHYHLIHIETLQMAMYFLELEKFANKNNIFFLDDDSPSFNFSQKKQFWLILEKWKYFKVEKRAIDISKITAVFSEQEKNFLIENFNIPYNKIKVIHHPLKLKKLNPERETQTQVKSNLIFLGNFSHKPNVDGIKWFIEKVFPLLIRELPDIKLKILGANFPRSKIKIKYPNIELIGYVERIENFLTKDNIMIAPIISGGGVRAKVLDAMACGCPVVGTPLANYGINAKDGSHILIADNETEFLSKIKQLYFNPSLRRKLSENARKFVKEIFDENRVLSEIKNIYLSLIEQDK